MSRIKQIVKEHKIAIVMAVFLSVIAAFPQWYFRIDQKEIYQGIELTYTSPWVPRVREIQDGHLNWGSIYYKEGKNLPYLFQPLGSAVVAYMGSIFSLDIGDTILLSFIILSPIVFILLYLFVLLLSKSKLIALSSSATVLMAGPILYLPGLKRLLTGISPRPFLELSGPVNPAMIYIFVFAFLISFWMFYRSKSWKWGIASAILLGLNFYNYVYSWTYLYAFSALLVLIFLFQKKWQEAARIFYVLTGGVLVAIPYFINLYRAMQHSVYETVGIRGGLVFSHAPLSVGLVVIGTLILFFLLFPREDKERFYFALALVLTPFITMNQQIITGKTMQPAHYHWYFHKPIAVIFVTWIAFSLLSRFGAEFYKKMLAVSIIATSLYAGIFTQVSSYLHDGEYGRAMNIELQKYGPVMSWLSENAEKEAVVFANEKNSDLVVIYTPLNVFHHVKGHLSLAASEERMRNTLFTYYRLGEVNKDNARELFHGKERTFISTRMYGIYYRQALGSYEAVPNEKIDKFTDLYKEALAIPLSKWLHNVWSKYEVEYLIWDKVMDPSWKLDRFSYLDKVAEFNNIAIYRFNR